MFSGVEDQRTYGPTYFYDTVLISKKLESYLEKNLTKGATSKPNAIQIKVRQFLELVTKVNIDMSLVDAQLVTTKAWATFLQVQTAFKGLDGSI